MLIFRHTCDVCQARLFRAPIVVLGRRYCRRCAARTAREATAAECAAPPASSASPAKAPSVANKAERRGSPRFSPPSGAALFVRRPRGLLRFLSGGNLVRVWLDVSLAGLAAVLQGTFKENDTLEAQIRYEKFRDVFEVRVRVIHVTPSKKFPGASVVGVEFIDPPGALRTFLANAHEETLRLASHSGGRT